MKLEPTAQPNLYIGIDIHKRSWKVHCATEPPNPKVLNEYVAKHFPDHQVNTAYEAGCCGYYAHRSFKTYGWISLVVNPADIHRKGRSVLQRLIK